MEYEKSSLPEKKNVPNIISLYNILEIEVQQGTTGKIPCLLLRLLVEPKHKNPTLLSSKRIFIQCIDLANISKCLSAYPLTSRSL